MTGQQRSNIEIVFADWLDAMRRGDIDRMERALAPDVVHAGVRPDWVCNGRDAVLDMARNRSRQLPEVLALELVAAGEHVVMSVRGPELGPEPDDSGNHRGQACVVFTLRDGLIVHMQDYLRRADALSAAGAEIAWQ
jgi:ketosteroid isomerase-like protein